MSDLEDAANGKLTTSKPSASDGLADVSATARYCSRCDRYVEPVGKGACPTCFAFLPKNSAARRHPISVSRREALFAENVAEYKPDTLLLRRVCRKVANIEERLESVKEGTPEHQRLISMSSELTAILEASRSREIRATDTDLAALSDDQLIERTTTILRSLLDARDEQRRGEAFLAEHAGLAVLTAAGPAGEAVASTVVPAPELVCEYCHQTLTRCAEIKATRIESWEALHYNDPAEIKRRDEHATAVMRKQLGRGLPDWYRS